MSRIGKKPIPIPQGVDVQWEPGTITVSGPLGTLTKKIPAEMIVKREDGFLLVERPSDERTHRALHGLTRTLIANMVEGVSKGYQRVLEVVGVGYRAQKEGEKLSLSVGYAQPKVLEPLPGITFEVGQDVNTRMPLITVKGIDKEVVGQQAALIRRVRPPEPYKGMGIRYRGEQIRRKAGKSGKAGGKGKGK
ncbi:MAG: 50S ribosomal protein L6 [Armatimonadota bacterium]|nr:MAG: 50S ribosomal protein L6 [Armatimonadota bacterium]